MTIRAIGYLILTFCLGPNYIAVNASVEPSEANSAVSIRCAVWLQEYDYAPLTRSEAEMVCQQAHLDDEVLLNSAKHYACVSSAGEALKEKRTNLNQFDLALKSCERSHKTNQWSAGSYNQALRRSPLGNWPPRSAVPSITIESQVAADTYCADMTDRIILEKTSVTSFLNSCTDFILSDAAHMPFYQYQACLINEFGTAQRRGEKTDGEDAESRDLRQKVFKQCRSIVEDAGENTLRTASSVATRNRRRAPWVG